MNKKILIYGIVILAAAFIFYLIVRQVTSPGSPDEQEAVTCGTKTVYRYKYPSKAFPIFASEYNAEIKFTTDVLKKIDDSVGSVDIGLNVKNQVKELQEKLNQDNITFSTGLRNFFFTVNSDPCNDTLRNRYATFTEEMSRRMLELRTITSQVTTIEQKGTSATSQAKDGDTSKMIVPKYKLLRDSVNITKSILKLNEVIKANQKINRTIIPNILPKQGN